MIKQKYTSTSPDSVVSKLTDYLTRDSNVIFALVFGSYAAKESNEKKIIDDIDVAIYFNNPPQELEHLEYANRLSRVAGYDIDLVILNHASAFLRHQVMKYGMRLVIKDPVIYRTFREKTIRDYQEYKYIAFMDIYDR